MHKYIAVVSTVVLLAAVAGDARAQRCIGLPDTPGYVLSGGFEGTDGLSGVSGAFAQFYDRWGYQLRLERYDDQPRQDAWYGKEVQAVTRVGRSLFSPRCLFVAIRFHDGGAGSVVSHRTRLPVGFAIGRTFGPKKLQWTAFVQPALMMQLESARDVSLLDRRTKTRTNVTGAATVGLTAISGRFLARSYVHYAALPEHTMIGRHNWPELTVHIGWLFEPFGRDDP